MQALQSQLTSQAVAKMKWTAINLILSTWSHEETINCPIEVQEQVPTSSWKYNKKGEESFTWLTFDENFQGAFCKILQEEGNFSSKKRKNMEPFKNWKKAIKKMKTHAKSDIHIQSCEAEVAAYLWNLIIMQGGEPGYEARWLQLEHQLFSYSNKLVTKKNWRTRWLLKPLFVAPIFSLLS